MTKRHLTPQQLRRRRLTARLSLAGGLALLLTLVLRPLFRCSSPLPQTAARVQLRKWQAPFCRVFGKQLNVVCDEQTTMPSSGDRSSVSLLRHAA